MPAAANGRFGTPLSTLIHDLRQPLSTIETCAFFLREVLKDVDDPRVFENLDRIERQVAEADRILLEAARGHDQQPAGSRCLTNAESAAGT